MSFKPSHSNQKIYKVVSSWDSYVIRLFCRNVTIFLSLAQAIRLSLEQALPPEPKEEGGEPISKLRIRTPSGEFLERQFLGSCKLQVLFDFVASKGYPSDEFKLLTTFPRRNVSSHMHTNIYYRFMKASSKCLWISIHLDPKTILKLTIELFTLNLHGNFLKWHISAIYKTQ